MFKKKAGKRFMGDCLDPDAEYWLKNGVNDEF